jgi:hypothetical protein
VCEARQWQIVEADDAHVARHIEAKVPRRLQRTRRGGIAHRQNGRGAQPIGPGI